MKKRLDEEARTLLRRIVESQAHREIMSINMLGHCLKYVTELETKLRVAEDLNLSLRLFREVQALYADLGWQDLDSAVRDRMTELPFPESRLEFGVAYHLGHVALHLPGAGGTTLMSAPRSGFVCQRRASFERPERRIARFYSHN